jgi:septum formation topological specificity factor MinE
MMSDVLRKEVVAVVVKVVEIEERLGSARRGNF